jgi:hypothetical protein
MQKGLTFLFVNPETREGGGGGAGSTLRSRGQGRKRRRRRRRLERKLMKPRVVPTRMESI